MKIITIGWLVLATLLVVLNHAGNYWLGYSETPTALAVTNRFFGLLLVIALFLLFIIPALWTELARKQRLWSYIGLLGFWPLVILTFYMIQAFATPGGELISQGVRDRVMRDVTLDELRHFAKDVNDAGFLKDEDVVNPLDLSPLTSQQRDSFAKLGTKYPFMHWLDDGDQLRGPSLLNCGQDNVVNFEWAVKNRGHWGCSISIDGAKNETIPFPNATILRVSDDIYFYYRT